VLDQLPFTIDVMVEHPPAPEFDVVAGVVLLMSVASQRRPNNLGFQSTVRPVLDPKIV